MKKYGNLAIRDSGVPNGSDHYVTLVMVHGFAWHSGIFSRLLRLSEQFNARIIVVNRRDYPDSDPLDDDEILRISSITEATPGFEAAITLNDYMKRRAKELYDFLEILIQTENIPSTGGMVVAGWSFGANLITALLANAATFPMRNLDVAAYIRRVVLYDPPYHTLGYPPPVEFYNPLSDQSLAPGEGARIFPAWVSGYYIHGDSSSELEHRIALPSPRPTIETMSEEEITSALLLAPTMPGGSDAILLEAGIRYGLYSALRKAALSLPANVTSLTDSSLHHWDNVKLQYLWCDQSVWEVPWGTWSLKSELEAAKLMGTRMREVQLVRLEGANHFAHWDQPERLLLILLADDTEL